MAIFQKTNKGVHYSRAGKAGQAVVFIHGFLEDIRMWEGFIHRVPDYSVIKVDLPGFGQSSVQTPISIAGYAQSVKEVLDIEGIKKAILIGHSMGGYTAMAFAKKYPVMLKGISLFHSQPYPDTPENKVKRKKSALFVEKHGGSAYVKATIPNLFAPAFAKKNPKIIKKVIQYGIKTSPEAIIAAIYAMQNRIDTSDILAQLDIPVQFIIGTEDIAIPEANSLRQTTLPNVADVHILKNIGHMGHLEATAKTKRIIRDFIRFC